MPYKTIILGLLEQNPLLHELLRRQRKLSSTLELYSSELKMSHQAWQERLSQARPGSDESLLSSEAMEIAVKEFEDRLLSESRPEEDETLSLDGAMAYIRRHTPPA
jgi:hypothetical protein